MKKSLRKEIETMVERQKFFILLSRMRIFKKKTELRMLKKFQVTIAELKAEANHEP